VAISIAVAMWLEVIYNLRGDNRREGGFMSYHSRSRKLCAFTEKEPETVRAAQKLLGALTIGGGSAQARGAGGGSQWSHIRPHAAQNVQKR
jgi:hypothetical protein